MFYLITVVCGSLSIALLNFLFGGIYTLTEFGILLLFTVIGVVAVVAIDGVAAFIVRRLPEKWFAPEAKLFSVSKTERKFYRRSGIGRWKKYVPEWGCFTGFHKDKMREPENSAYVGRFLLESNYGVLGHVVGAALGFLILLLPFLPTLTMALPIALINLVLSLLPTMVLRSNTPALRGLYKRNLQRESKTKAENSLK